jgi:hypothetical protein
MSDSAPPPKRDVSTTAMTGVTILGVAFVAFIAIFYSINHMDLQTFGEKFKAEDMHLVKFLGKNELKLNAIHNSGVALVNVVWDALGLGEMRRSFEGWNCGNLYVAMPNAFLWWLRRFAICMIALLFTGVLCIYPWCRMMWERRKNAQSAFVPSPKGYDVGLTLIIAGSAYFFAYSLYFMPISGEPLWLVLFMAGMRFVFNIFRGKFEYLIPLVFVGCAQFTGIFGVFFGSLCMVYGTVLLTRNFPEHV